MNHAVQRYLEAATGLGNLTASKAEQIAKQLVRSGEAAGDQVGDLVDDLLDRQRKNRDAVTALVRSETNRAVRAMGLATNREMERLQKQVADLKRELTRTARAAMDTRTGAAASARVSASRGGGSPTAAAPTERTAAKKSTAKKSTAKKSAAKSAAKKSAAKKSTAKKTTAKKATG
jgi:polyhydroxyalkanoate synthesis regulator phasin